MLAATLSNFALDTPSLTLLEPLWWLTAATTLGSGFGYLDGTGFKKLKDQVATNKSISHNISDSSSSSSSGRSNENVTVAIIMQRGLKRLKERFTTSKAENAKNEKSSHN